MIDYEEILVIPPYSLDKNTKEQLLSETLRQLTIAHYNKCVEYKRMLDAIGFNPEKIKGYYDIPFLPVSLFKELELLSVDKSAVFKIMTSSGTTGQAVSKIFLDKTTSSNQQKTLVKIVSNFTNSARLPMLIIDSPSVIKNRSMFSARGAGILGFSIFGTDKTYALDDDMTIDFAAIESFLDRHQGQKIMLFGFTYMVWHHFYKELLKAELRIDLSKGILIHGGGWKKLIAEAVSPDQFKQCLEDVCGLSDIHDYYGMVEQTGSIYMECEYGHLHASIFSDIITRRHLDFSPCDINETGIIQVVSMLPESYPGHSLLTEDEGVILGEDDCPCGRKGKYFIVLGRLQNAR
ncbi:LuxE/PaaK family acyltransferase [Syntrophomonas palmitatica]|uniref:LuxE/PaaK family acyltransferase n=1 Tax=Syntrophomonas palmitatica TaxID=402877 RepID=UPI000AE4BB28